MSNKKGKGNEHWMWCLKHLKLVDDYGIAYLCSRCYGELWVRLWVRRFFTHTWQIVCLRSSLTVYLTDERMSFKDFLKFIYFYLFTYLFISFPSSLLHAAQSIPIPLSVCLLFWFSHVQCETRPSKQIK